ncbi:hypothetical protein A4H97_02455 [Niastella yeongjuensis]|uniref:Uncharacterized protein n=2 Tax=Niastella yeongjuensis TaxID=354355 RepID=A0A1V9EX60_9BACT|nr:hypothetical protein [Niastella yeongjuensis]OQP50719.1 hypothetical protein A4H97_02455 [Niastella yeongjuensis]SEN21105.1 hypothetical protein SAMN05660816_00453 [Niastella yeongjuensis]
MNLKHPYEKHLAEKLVQLPPPGDPDQNWQQMKTLLDNDMPRGGGAPGGSYRWWVAGTVIVAMLVGTWFGGKQLITKEQRNQSVAGTIKTVNNKNASAVASTEKNVEQPATKNKKLPGAAYAATTTSTPADAAVSNNQQPDIVVTNNGNNELAPGDNAAKARSSGNNILVPHSETTSKVPNNPTDNNKISPDRKNIYAVDSKNDNKRTVKNHPSNSNRKPRSNTHSGKKAAADAGVVVMSGAAVSKFKKQKGQHPVNHPTAGANKNRSRKGAGEQDPFRYKPTILPPLRSLPSLPSAGLKESPVTYKINYTGGAVISPSGMVQRDFSYYMFPDKAVATKKSGRRKSPFSTNEDKTFAFGLSLPMGFPIGDQEPLAYNSKAGVNTISDYIPSPHFQYHFNNKTYLQAGLQFKAPQFIHPLLLYQNQVRYQQGPTIMEQVTNITARKLYYFNIPLTIYHSPLKNFYMGTGLQYSNLLSGVAQYEQIEKRYSPLGPPQEYLVQNYFTQFKNDSLSNRLNGSEVRLLVDMSYYWSRFTVGLQYSQAFNNYVSIQVNPPLSPYVFDKNKSLQFYLRYNIWEDKKRRQPKGQSLLTLK